jgi:glycerophosphoryl diester phosphodiesterase
VAEGARLLSGYGGSTSIAGSNPAFSASLLKIAHRGYAAQGGENSLATIAAALVLGCDVVEVDVRRRRDGALVLHHDDPNRPGAPLLADALRLIAASTAGANLDVKQSEAGPGIVEAVRSTGMLGRTTCTGGGWEGLALIRSSEPGIRIGLTMPRRGSTLPRIIRKAGIPYARHQIATQVPTILQRYGADLVTVYHRLVDRRVVAAVHENGGEIWTWTVDDPRELARLEELGVDGVCSDRPSSHGLG